MDNHVDNSPRVLGSFAELARLAGQELGVSGWRLVTQAQIDAFAEATGDHQWIHTDPARAARETLFGGTIAHGFLTLSLAPALLSEILELPFVRMGINYGCNQVRFISPVPAGSRVRMRASLKSVEPYAPAGQRVTFACILEREGAAKPACAAELISILFD
ncbi:MAG: MaoC family dehydratase [Bacteroidia bacterium]|nr:MaoC family dehydratase [Bacteroidia bacterium]